MICRTEKPDDHKGYILFINAVNEVTRKNAQSFLEPQHIEKIAGAYHTFKSDDDIAKKVSIREVERNGFNLSLPLYVRPESGDGDEDYRSIQECYNDWRICSQSMASAYQELTALLGKEAKADE